MNEGRLSVIYSFKIKEGKEKEFIENWTEATRLIYQHEGSLGSRLHKVDEHLFIAYALWPDEKTFNRAGYIDQTKASKELREKRNLMVEEFKQLYKGDVLVDLISNETY